jgi:phage protein D
MASLKASGLPDVSYYAPDFKLEIEGVELNPDTRGDVLEVKVVMDMENLTSFELSINNWDDEVLDFKYSDGDQFTPGNQVHVQLGYADRLISMVTGKITTLTPRFPESGQPTLGVSGLDNMLLLRDRHPVDSDTRQWLQMQDWQIAQEIAQRNNLRFQATEDGPTQDRVLQRNLDDAQFVMERAKRIDFDCFVHTDPQSGESTLHFERPTDARDQASTRIYQFRWGESLIAFTPTLTTARQVARVSVRGWDPRTKQPIVGRASKSDLPGTPGGGGTSGPEIAEKKLGAKQEVVVDAPVDSQEEADARARELLLKRAYDYITGTGQCIGLPDLRPGDNVELLALGQRFSGTYYVKKVEHTLGASGYHTQFEVRKIYDGGAIAT